VPASCPTTAVLPRELPLSLVSQVCAFSLNAGKNKEQFVIVVSCVAVLPAAMRFRQPRSCCPVGGNTGRFCLVCTLLIGLRIKLNLS